jgi:hypothetical protein
MKLQINRRETMKGLIFKKPRYDIDVNLEVTPDELTLIKKHKWQEKLLAEMDVFGNGTTFKYKTKDMIGTHTHSFWQIEQAADFEKQVIENARILKSNLETSAGFTADGPREVQL